MAATSIYRPLGNKLYIYEFIDILESAESAGRNRMSTRLGIVMDPLQSIKVYKDSSFAMLLAAQARGWLLLYMEQADLYLRDGRAFGRTRQLEVRDQAHDWFELGAPSRWPLNPGDSAGHNHVVQAPARRLSYEELVRQITDDNHHDDRF